MRCLRIHRGEPTRPSQNMQTHPKRGAMENKPTASARADREKGKEGRKYEEDMIDNEKHGYLQENRRMDKSKCQRTN